MNRHVVAGMLGLALAGCAQDRSILSRSRAPLPAVELPSVPSIHETINKENAEVDPGSVRSGHPAELADQGEAPRVAGASREADPSSPAGRPAPFADRVRGTPRPRAEASRPPVTADTSEPARDQGPAPAPAEPRNQPEPLPEAGNPTSLPPANENAAPAPTRPETRPADLPTAPDPGPSAGPVVLPTPSSTAAGRVKVPVPGATPSPGSFKAEGLGDLKRDPLLGSDPDLMPPMDMAPAPGSPKGGGTEAPKIPATVPVLDPPSGASSTPSPPPAVEPIPTLPPPTTPAPPALPPPAAPPAGSGASVPSVDPLLGPNPEIMPEVRMPPRRAASDPAAAPTGPVRRLEVSPQAGLPPLVRDLPKNGRSRDAQPAPAAPAPAAPAEGLSSPIPAEAPVPSPGEAASPVGPTADPTTTPDWATDPTPTPAPVGNPAPPPRRNGERPPAPAPAGSDAGPLAPSELPPPVQAPATPGGDPLLGPNPEIMPPVKAPTVPARRPAPAPPPRATPTPAADPAPAPQPAPTPVASPAPVPTAAPAPVPGRAPAADPLAEPVELPPLSDPPAAKSGEPGSAMLATPGGSVGFASVPVSAPPAKTTAREPETPSAPSEPAAVRSEPMTRSVFEAGRAAARVGDDVITLHELKVAVAQRRKGMPTDRPLSTQERTMLARMVLNDLVDRSVVLQEAKHELKNQKNYKAIMDAADKLWMEEELPPMLRRQAAANIYELQQKLADKGESLDETRQQFRLEFLSRGYLEQKLGPKMRVDLHEMRDYYMTHLKDFDLPAQVTWREVLVEVDKSKSRAEAGRRADALLARLRRGEDFAKVAAGDSDGPNKAKGGFWQTTPGSYAVPAVNAALASLPVGRISGVLEGPTSYHVVRVEGRRRAGPATFAEVQDKIKRAIRQEKVHRESTAYLDKLRKRTYIHTVFDDPGVVPASAERVDPAAAPPRR